MTPDISAIAQRITAEVEESYGHCCNEGGTNLAIGPETFAELLTQAISEATASLRAQLATTEAEREAWKATLSALGWELQYHGVICEWDVDKKTATVLEDRLPKMPKEYERLLKEKREAEGERDVALARLAEIGEHLMSAEEPTVEEKPLKTIEELSGCIDFGGRVVFDSETDEQYIVPLPASPQVAPESPLNGKGKCATCNHPRSDHGEEQNYECYGLVGDDPCECQGYSYVAPLNGKEGK